MVSCAPNYGDTVYIEKIIWINKRSTMYAKSRLYDIISANGYREMKSDTLICTFDGLKHRIHTQDLIDIVANDGR